ncbi:DNA sulfur modification protein DndE [Nocardiopsis sp. FIRDI 009]|uniref:DNA sulfur modification protein DndE n=1 Tax=Nocardiopsis sp. FIRDI 009 TaxID=714197 RepID=UPI000E245916|nr:DNA sulfur modification protein DndE [Nocardiopsis sp. FIRDI 009]
MSLETVRLSQTARDQLIRLKRVTGIQNWNVLCRWGLLVSLRDPSPPLVREIITDSNVEMTWRTFAGSYAEIYMALLKLRCERDGLEVSEQNLGYTLTVHLHRGIGFIAGRRDMKSVVDLVSLV